MKHHFIKTENYRNLLDGVRFMQSKGSPSACLCLLHGDPGVGKTRNVSKWGADEGAILVKGHVGMTLDGIIWAVNNGLGLKGSSNRTQTIEAQVAALRQNGQPIVFDEAQFGLKMKQGGDRGAGIEYLRDIAERGSTYVLLVCHQSEVPGFSESKHIRTRIAHRIEMKDATAEDTSAFIRGLCEVEISDDACALVHQQTGGKFRLLENAIATLERIASVKKVSGLTGADIAGVTLVVDHEQGLIPKIAPKPAKAGGR